MVAAHIIAECRKCTRVQWSCYNKVNHFPCSVQNVFQAVRHSLGRKSLLVDACTRVTTPLCLPGFCAISTVYSIYYIYIYLENIWGIGNYIDNYIDGSYSLSAKLKLIYQLKMFFF